MDDDLWNAEFCGFAWGEASLLVHTYNRKGKQLFRAAFKIGLRDDDAEILYEFQRRLGGHIFGPYTYAKANPAMMWQVNNLEQLKRIRDILSKGVLPAKKRNEIALWGEFLDMAHARGKKYSIEEKERVHKIINDLKELRRYKQGGQDISA